MASGKPMQTRRWPSGHSGWCFSGAMEFEGRVASYLAEGARRGERLMLVVDDPNPGAWPHVLLDRGELLIASTAETYGVARVVDAASQRATFERVLEDALDAGFTGIRVAADNTSLIDRPDRLAAWMRWEGEADELMRARPVTGVCGFDRSRADADALSVVMGAHAAICRPHARDT